MGRPINKRFFGATGDNTQPTIAIRYHDGTSSREGYILSQRGTNKFNCDSAAVVATKFVVFVVPFTSSSY